MQDDKGICHCDSGYTPKNKECVDINECAMENTCSTAEDCENTLGGYRCFCKSGYVRDPDTGTCISKGLIEFVYLFIRLIVT